MAFDGITIANIVQELNDTVTGGKINKIAQPEHDELLITVKNNRQQYRLFLSANASLPLVYLTDTNKPGPQTAPNFCMLLRKHIGSARILSVSQPGLERIIQIRLEHRNELGDLCRKYLMVEIMGKHSNLIFCDEDFVILDSIKHVSSHMSSVREVLPGRDYFIPQTQQKDDPLTVTEEQFLQTVLAKPMPLAKALYSSLTGISPLIGEELCHRACIDGGKPANTLTGPEQLHIWHTFRRLTENIREGTFTPAIWYRGGEPAEFSSLPLTMYQDLECVPHESISEMLQTYYAEKNALMRIRQKSADLRHVVQTSLERSTKKLALQQKQMQDTKKREKYRVYGEMIHTYGYGLEEGAKSFEALNYETNEMITIPLDPMLTPQENANRYFERYQKLKRTAAALSDLIVETENEIRHLESISAALDFASAEEDLLQIRQELAEYGYIKKQHNGRKREKVTSRPFHYLSSDGFHMYVGKNNYQNMELSFGFANGGDWWFHAKGQPGSHVIVKTNGLELPDRTFEEAGRLAAYYSKGREAPRVEIDYTRKKNLRKPNGSMPGFVVYYTNYSLMAEPDISDIQRIDS